ncbi:MAG: hypothetical protein V1689_00220 [Pseudomonadota bacterium]
MVKRKSEPERAKGLEIFALGGYGGQVGLGKARCFSFSRGSLGLLKSFLGYFGILPFRIDSDLWKSVF